MPESTCVTLALVESPNTSVTVGVQVELHGVKAGQHTYRSKFEQPPSLQADPACITKFQTAEKHVLSCLGSALSGIANLEKSGVPAGTCVVTILEGTELRYDSGVGFALAAQIAG